MVLFSGDAAGQLLLLLIAPIVTRLYTPEEFGVATVYTAVLALAVVISALRYELAVPVPVDDDDGVNVLFAALVSAAAMSVVGVGAYLVIGNSIEALDDGLPTAVALLFGLSLMLNGSIASLGGWMIRRQRYDLLARSRLARMAGQAGLQVGLGAAGWGAMGLVVAALAGSAIGVAILATSFVRHDADRIQVVSRAGIRHSFVRYRRFPIFSGSAAFVQAVNLEIPYVVFGTIYGRADVGAMGLARRSLGTPLYTLSGAVGQVFFGHGAELVRTAPERLHRFVLRMTLATAAVFVPIGLVAFIALPPLTTRVFGDEWAVAADFIRVMVPMFVFTAIAAPTGYALDIIERQDLHLVRDLIRLAIGLTAIGLILLIDPSALRAMFIYVVFACVGAAVYLVTSLTAIERHRRGLETDED